MATKINYALKMPFKGRLPVWMVYLVVLMMIIMLYVAYMEVIHTRKLSSVIACYENANQDISPVTKVKLPILMYHYVEHVKNPYDRIRIRMNIRPEQFEQQVIEIKKGGYQTVFMRDVPKMVESTNGACSYKIALTFDDGYEDFYNDVFPILKRQNVKATVYIITDFINKPGFLTTNEIKELVASGLVEIGSHTLNHSYLKQTSYNEAKRQIVQSKKVLEHAFHIQVDTFAYPFGAFDAQAIELVKEASYSAALTVMPGSYISNDNLYLLPRIRPEELLGGNTATMLDMFVR
jgi:peptidoglycan/xylan/chitin deacetylase (PgdA/CDA1 family)